MAHNLEEQLFRWLRVAELTCDRGALLVVQDPKSRAGLIARVRTSFQTRRVANALWHQGCKVTVSLVGTQLLKSGRGY
ncbi:hypothetical protein HanHA89_Chr05g0198811 [Helianthus annuus]|nr:hypothetical protein HanHA89_Chr05g0198811 [Helianthus annuus]